MKSKKENRSKLDFHRQENLVEEEKEAKEEKERSGVAGEKNEPRPSAVSPPFGGK